MGGRFEVIDRPVGRDDGAFFAGHTPVLLALRAGRMFGGFVGVGHQGVCGEAGRNRHRHGVCRPLDLLEGHGLRSRERMVVLRADDSENLVGDLIEFFPRWFCEGHGQFGG